MGTGLRGLGEKQVNFSASGVNDGLAGTQADPAVVALSNGDFVVVYENPEAGSNIDLLAHFFDANGNAIGPPVSSGLQNGVVGIDRLVDPTIRPAVAATPDGGFLVAYTDMAITDNIIVVRRYDPTTGISGPFVIDTGAGPAHQPNIGPVDSSAIATFANGTSIIAWEFAFAGSGTDHDLYFSFLNSAANGFTHPTNTLAVSNNFEGEARAAARGNLAAIVYAVNPGTIGGGQDVTLRLFNSSATEAAAPSTIFGFQNGDIFSHPDVAALSDGRFVIVAQDDTTSALVASIYNPVTHTATPVVHISDATGVGTDPHVAGAPGGGFVVSFDNSTGDVIEARFGPGASALFSEGVAHSFSTGSQDQNAIAANASGTVFLAWRDAGSGNPNSTDTDPRIEGQAFRLQQLAQPNFNGDSFSDVFWRNTNGDVSFWNSNGSGGFSGQDLGVVASSYQAAGVGDFNGDGHSDILWRNANGDVSLWNSNGSGGFTGQDLGVVSNSDQVAAVGDFNGDGQADVLWRNTNGDAILWKSNGSGGFTGQDLGVVSTSYQVAGIGDFNGDGQADVLWRNTNGDAFLWKSNGAGGFSGQDLGVVSTSYQVAGIGDFNGDGNADILWRHTSGDAFLWNSNGAGGFTGQDLGVVSNSYQVAGVGDFSGDGEADILWRHTSGDAFLWKSNGSGGFGGQDLGVVDSSWAIQHA
jgi:hypothetical protein